MRHDGQMLDTFEEVGGGPKPMDEDDEEWSENEGGAGGEGAQRGSGFQAVAQDMLDRFARYLTETTSIQEVTIKYVAEPCVSFVHP